jgi:hypothetical protein
MKHSANNETGEKAQKQAVEAVEISYPIPVNDRYAESITCCK